MGGRCIYLTWTVSISRVVHVFESFSLLRKVLLAQGQAQTPHDGTQKLLR